MTVLRIVSNIAATDPAPVVAFYRRLLGLEVAMDAGWIVTLGGATGSRAQVSVASSGGSGTPVPNLSVEVDDVEAVYAIACEANFEIVYPLTTEPWNVRRFYVRDPVGTVVNVLAHCR